MIKHVYPGLQVDEQQLNKQLEEIKAIVKMREKLHNTKFPVSNTHFQKMHLLCFLQILYHI